MSGRPDDDRVEDPMLKGHPSQAEGADSEGGEHRDPALDGHPSQAEGEDTDS